jgi:hypothetical protein
MPNCAVCGKDDGDVKAFTVAAAYGHRELQGQPVCYPCALDLIRNPKHEPDYSFEREKLKRNHP